jgi:predicted deacylase
VYGGSQEASGQEGDAVPSASRDLGEESVPAELVDDARCASAATTGLLGVGGRRGPQLILEVTVAESIDEMAARQDGLEQAAVGLGDGVEAGEVLTKLDARAAE